MQQSGKHERSANKWGWTQMDEVMVWRSALSADEVEYLSLASSSGLTLPVPEPSTLAALRELPAFAETPIVFMTAKVQPHEVQSYKDLGAVDVIPKPFDPMTLADQVKGVWRQARG